MEIPIQYSNLTYTTMLIRILLSVILGGTIGYERQLKHRPAGLRTHVLVCLGATVIMMVSEYSFAKYYLHFGITSDPLRLGAQVISGIGFLGAGTIIHNGNNVKGLTTAASLWSVASVGLAIGIGFYSLAVLATVAIYFTLFIFNSLSRSLNKNNTIREILLTINNKPKTIGQVTMAMSKYDIQILDMALINFDDIFDTDIPDNNVTSLKLLIKAKHPADFDKLIPDLAIINGVLSID